MFKNHNPLEGYFVKIYEIDPSFYKYYEKKYKLIKMGVLFRLDVYFNKFLLAVEIEEKGDNDRYFIFEQKRQKALEKTFVVNLLESIQVMQKTVMRLVIQKHLLMSLKIKKMKELEDKNKKLNNQLNYQ